MNPLPQAQNQIRVEKSDSSQQSDGTPNFAEAFGLPTEEETINVVSNRNYEPSKTSNSKISRRNSELENFQHRKVPVLSPKTVNKKHSVGQKHTGTGIHWPLGRSTGQIIEGDRSVDPYSGIFTMNQIKHIHALSELNRQGISLWNAGTVSIRRARVRMVLDGSCTGGPHGHPRKTKLLNSTKFRSVIFMRSSELKFRFLITLKTKKSSTKFHRKNLL